MINEKCSTWSKLWHIKIANNKSFILHIGKNNPKIQYKLGDNTLNEVETIRDLGIMVDNKLKFREHISKITRSAYHKMRIFFRLIKSRRIKVWTFIYKCYIRPILEFATEVWNPNLKMDVARVEKCQRFFTRIALKKCRLPHIPYQQRLDLFHLPTLECRRTIADLVLVHKIINKQTHLDPYNLFIPSKTRNEFPFQRIISKTGRNRFSFINRSINTWNKLDKRITSSTSTTQFKQNITRFILTENSYT